MDELREKIFGWILVGLLAITGIALGIATIGLGHALIRDWKNDPKNEYNFCSSAIHVKEDVYAVVSNEGNIFTFNSTEDIPEELEFRVYMDRGTQIGAEDDTIKKIELLFYN